MSKKSNKSNKIHSNSSNPINDEPVVVPERLMSNTDALQNVMTKAAIRHRDVTNPANNYYEAMHTLDYNQLENMYMTEWVAKKIVDMPVDYMYKNMFDLTIEGEESLEKECMDYYKEKKLNVLMKQAAKIKKIYGGGIIFPKDRFQDPMKPYDWESFKGRDIEFILKDLTYLAVTPHIHIVSDKYFEPETINMAGVSMLAENCIIFRGIQAPLRRMPQFRYLGMSMYQNIFQAMISDSYVSKGIVNMVYRGNMKYYRLDGFDETVKQGGDDLILQRIGLIEDGASIMSAGLLDAKDSVEFVKQSFQNLDKIDHRSLTRLSAASNIPSMVLLGRAPESSGLGDNSSGELENFYNYIEHEQRETDPELSFLFKIIAYILTGKEHKTEVFLKKPHNINPQKQAETDKIILENMQAQQSLGIPDDIVVDYGVKTGILTTEQATKVTELKNEMFKMAEYEAENEEEEIQPDANSDTE